MNKDFKNSNTIVQKTNKSDDNKSKNLEILKFLVH